ncbi:hypothetical protein ACIRHA_14280, partial [Streptomyces sp. NPDC102360]
MNRTVHEISRYEDARAALANPDLVPELPAAPEGKEGASMAWLRASVPRFSSGPAHARRRALVEAELARLDVARLRNAATRWPEADDVAPHVVCTLAEALGYREPGAVAEAVGIVARVYFGGEDPEADAAVTRLVELLSPPGQRQGADLGWADPGGLGRADPSGLGRLDPGGLGRLDLGGLGWADLGGLGRADPSGLGRLDPGGLGRPHPRGAAGQSYPDGLKQAPSDGLRQSDGAELAAARICLLVQARDATATLVRHAGTESVDTGAVGTAPVGTAAAGTRAVGTAPVGTAPVGTRAADTAPVGTAPVGTRAADTAPVGTAPVGTRAADTAPVDTAPTGTRAADTAP